MRQSKVESCLISAFGTSKRVKIYFRLEFYDTDSLFISGIVSEIAPNNPKIIADSQGSIEFVEEVLSKTIIASSHQDQQDSGMLSLYLPSLYLEMFAENEHFRKKFTRLESMSVMSKKKVKLVEAFFFQSMTSYLLSPSMQQIASDIFRHNKSLNKSKSYSSLERMNLAKLKSNITDSTVESMKDFGRYIEEISAAFYCRLQVDTHEYACGLSRPCSFRSFRHPIRKYLQS